MEKKGTYQEVARCAKVSVSTVARVANGNTRVARELQQRVRQATIKLGVELYTRERKSKSLAFILSNREMLHPFHSRILVGAQAASSVHGYNMLFLCVQYAAFDDPRRIRLPRIFETSKDISGFILAGVNFQNLLSFLAHRRVPFVVLGNNVVGEWESEKYDVVWFDDVQGAYEVTRYLQALGHRDIWYVGNCRLPWYARRQEGYRRAMEEAGLPPRVSEFDTTDEAQLGYLAAKSIVGRNEPVSAIFAGGDQAAQGACKSIIENRLRVPEHISVAGFSDTEAARWYPPLTTVQAFPEQISNRMVELLVDRIADPEAPPRHSFIPTQLIKRESCERFSPVPGPPTGEHQSNALVSVAEPRSSKSGISSEESQGS